MTLKEIRIKVLIYSICIFLIILLQSTVLEYMEIYHVKPNLMVVFIICVALLRGNVEGPAVGFFTGLVQDMLFGRVLGFYALLGLYLGLVIGSLNRRLYRENPFVVTFFTFISSIVYEGLVVFLSRFGAVTAGRIDLIFSLKTVILPEAVYNSVISILIYIFMARVSNRFDEVGKAVHKY